MTDTTLAQPQPTAAVTGEFDLARTFAAPRELVFEALTNAEHLLNWWGPRDFPAATFESVPEVGGAFNFVMVGPGGVEAPASGSYAEVTPPERIVLDQQVPHPDGSVWLRSRVTIELQELDGYTRMILMHRIVENHDFPGVAGAFEGWSQQFDKLGEYLVGVAR